MASIASYEFTKKQLFVLKNSQEIRALLTYSYAGLGHPPLKKYNLRESYLATQVD